MVLLAAARRPEETTAADPGAAPAPEEPGCVLLPEALDDLLDLDAPPAAHMLLPLQTEDRLLLQGLLPQEQHQTSHAAPVSQNNPIQHLRESERGRECERGSVRGRESEREGV